MDIGEEVEVVEVEEPAVPYEGEEVSPEPVEQEEPVEEDEPVEAT